MKSDEAMEIVKSINFVYELTEAMSALAFPHFGIRGWKEDYSGYFPPWILSYSLDKWMVKIEKVIGWGWKALYRLPKGASLAFIPHEVVDSTMAVVVKQVVEEENWQPIFDLVREMPCEEDFEPSRPRSRAKIDWHRSWYHSRSKRIKTVSLEECMEDEEHHIHEVAVDYSANTAEAVESEDFVARFKARLSPKDMAILELRVEGYTYEDIAKKLGYKNHSGVLKRMKAITAEYEQEQKQ